MLETLTIEDDGKVTLPDAVQIRYGFKPNTAVRLIETKSGVLLVPLTDAPMSAALQAELEEWQALGAPESANGDTAVPAPRVLATNLPVKDRLREDEWLRAHQGEYTGQYVALDGQRLVAHGNSFQEVATAARAAGVRDALVAFVESPDAPPYLGF